MLASFHYTWVFVSGDSGDWLASAKMWFVPQPYGSPLYILIAKIAGLFSNVEAAMTFLSIIPAAVAVGAVYQACYNLRKEYAHIGALVMLGAGILTTQAVIIEEYALAVMFLSLALLFYTYKRFNLTAVMLGLGTSVHIIMLPIAFLYFFVNRNWRQVPVYLACLMPYLLIPALMAMDTPRWFAGELSFASLNAYLASTGTIGKLALSATPLRLFYLIAFLAAGFGAAIIPALRFDRKNLFLILTAVFAMWLYLTDLDLTTWTFLIFAVPCIAILAVLGMKEKEKKLVTIVACGLIALNFLTLNVDRLDKHEASDYYAYLTSLPDGSHISVQQGYYAFAAYYAISQGKGLILD